MTANEITFGLVLTPRGGGKQWVDQVRRVEDQGFTTLLVPDTVWTPSPFPALAAAAAVTSRLRLRTWVLAGPLRTAPAVVREASALQVLSDGRFELGIGTGRPDAEREAAILGVPWGSAADRLAHIQTVIAAVRSDVTPAPPVVVTGSGPRTLAAAAATADRVVPALGPTAGPDDLRVAVDRIRAVAPQSVRISLQLSGVAGKLPEWLARGGLDAAALADAGAVGMLTGDVQQMADTVRERQEVFGIDECVVPGDLAEDFLPVLTELSR